MVFLLIFLGAVSFRLRGGAIPLGGTQIARVVYAALLTAGAFIAHPAWFMPLLFPALWLGSIPAWWGSIDLGRNETLRVWGIAPYWTDFARMAVRGFVFVALVFPIAYFFGSWWPLLLSTLAPVCYEVGWRTPSDIRFLKRGPEVGEAIFGALLGLTIYLSV
jgi:hypothetical protein